MIDPDIKAVLRKFKRDILLVYFFQCVVNVALIWALLATR
jgi:hypothetical protein